MFCGKTKYYVNIWKEEWLEKLQETGEGYKCQKISLRTTVLRGQHKTEVHREKVI